MSLLLQLGGKLAGFKVVTNQERLFSYQNSLYDYTVGDEG